MNKDFVLFNLTQTHEALGKLIADMKSDPEYDYGAYIVDIAHGVERARCDESSCR